ncbi:ABC transporter permease [Deinococcus pimensis]|uniref:ABC transporter permease n=1 Tax=Deinococcus pimensis TaxID=309888 RepID=UPI0004BA5DE2|nr:ABC transporter permease [Deinococcus pimensis]
MSGLLGEPAAARAPSSTWRSLTRRPELVTLLLIVALSLTIGLINDRFFSVQNGVDLLRSSIRTGIFALGVLTVLAAGGIDVSFTAIGVFALYVTTKLTMSVWPDAPFALMALASLAIGLGLGLVNGLIVYRFRVPSLIVTIGTQYVYRGALLAFVGTAYITDLPRAMDAFGRATLLQTTTADGIRVSLPAAFLVLVAVALLTWYVLRRTLLGRAVYAVGGSLPIAERLGFNVGRVLLFVFGYAGLLAGLGGLVHGAMNRQANPFDLVGSELDIIAAVVLGGARVTGGTGSVPGTLLGVVLVVIINNSLILMGVPSTWQKVVIGAIILVASGIFARRSATA